MNVQSQPTMSVSMYLNEPLWLLQKPLSILMQATTLGRTDVDGEHPAADEQLPYSKCRIQKIDCNEPPWAAEPVLRGFPRSACDDYLKSASLNIKDILAAGTGAEALRLLREVCEWPSTFAPSSACKCNVAFASLPRTCRVCMELLSAETKQNTSECVIQKAVLTGLPLVHHVGHFACTSPTLDFSWQMASTQNASAGHHSFGWMSSSTTVLTMVRERFWDLDCG